MNKSFFNISVAQMYMMEEIRVFVCYGCLSCFRMGFNQRTSCQPKGLMKLLMAGMLLRAGMLLMAGMLLRAGMLGEMPRDVRLRGGPNRVVPAWFGGRRSAAGPVPWRLPIARVACEQVDTVYVTLEQVTL